jgi:hypothetical protein
VEPGPRRPKISCTAACLYKESAYERVGAQAPFKVIEDLNISPDGNSAFRKNPDSGETEIYRKWNDEWHGPYGPVPT